MIPSKEKLIGLLPPFKDERVLIKENQRVDDIIKQLLDAHDRYTVYYDKFALLFDDKSTLKICENICDFLKKNIRYVEESDKDQTTALPTAILEWAQGDCKHYASFTGGILDAITRLTGKKINWCYRFASYDLLSKSPHHVFVVVFDKGNEIWIDPVPGADKLTPVWQLDETVKNNSMALHDVIGGIPETTVSDNSLSPQLTDAIQLLLNYGVINENADVNTDLFEFLLTQSDPAESDRLNAAYNLLYSSSTIGGLFASIAHAAAKIQLAPGRAAFLLLVSQNFRSWAKNMNAIFSDPKIGADAIEQVRAKWYPLGGDWSQLMNAVNDGKDKKQLGSIGMAVAAAVTLAAGISAALVPVINAVMKNLPASQQLPAIVPITTTTTSTSANSIMTWIKANPLPVVAVLGGAAYLVLNDKKKKVGKAKDYMPLYLVGGAALVFWLMKKAAENKTPAIVNPVPVEPVEIIQPDPVPANLDPNSPFYNATSYEQSNNPYPTGKVLSITDANTMQSNYSFL
jgi:hypothetical protein